MRNIFIIITLPLLLIGILLLNIALIISPELGEYITINLLNK